MIGNSEGPTLGWGSRGYLTDEQTAMTQAARDLNACLLVSQVNSLTPPALSFLAFGLVNHHLFCLCNSTFNIQFYHKQALS